MGHKDLPLASGERHAKAFERCGWTRIARRGRGSHILLVKAGVQATLSIPNHPEVKRALLASQLALAGISIETYCAKFR